MISAGVWPPKPRVSDGSLAEVVTIVTLETLLRWDRKLIAEKYDGVWTDNRILLNVLRWPRLRAQR